MGGSVMLTPRFLLKLILPWVVGLGFFLFLAYRPIVDQWGNSFPIRPSDAELRDLERSVLEGGHQPWRLDPYEVACVELGAFLKEHEKDGFSQAPPARGDRDSWTIKESGDRVAAIWSGGGFLFRVDLENTRSERKGVWFADRIQVDPR